jgi:thiol-disulfide isomerase/thioredoxin
MFSFQVNSTNLPEKLLNIPINLISGETTSLSEYEGKKAVYIKFWATWCQPCRKEMPHFEHIKNEYGDYVEVIGINIGINDDIKAVEATIKEFGLTMPMAIDKSGDLAQAFRFIGTPYHLLFDRNLNLIHRGHKANESLDNKLALISQSKSVDLLNIDSLSDNEPNLKIDLNDNKIHALFFTATWCDWYLKDSRPQSSNNCISAQKNVNVLSATYPDIIWNGVVSRLWTGNKDLNDYKKKYSIKHAIEIDMSNSLFHQYSVNDLPTLLLIKNNKVILKVTNFSDSEELKKLIGEQKA